MESKAAKTITQNEKKENDKAQITELVARQAYQTKRQSREIHKSKLQFRNLGRRWVPSFTDNWFKRDDA